MLTFQGNEAARLLKKLAEQEAQAAKEAEAFAQFQKAGNIEFGLTKARYVGGCTFQAVPQQARTGRTLLSVTFYIFTLTDRLLFTFLIKNRSLKVPVRNDGENSTKCTRIIFILSFVYFLGWICILRPTGDRLAIVLQFSTFSGVLF